MPNVPPVLSGSTRPDYEIPVDVGAPTPDNIGLIRSKGQMIQLLQEICQWSLITASELGLMKPDLLLHTSVVEKSASGHPVGVQADFDLLHHVFRFPLAGFVMQKGVGAQQFQATAILQYQGWMKRLERAQPNATWAVCAVRIYDDTGTMTMPVGDYDRKGAPGRPDLYQLVLGDAAKASSKTLSETSRTVQNIKAQWLCVEMAAVNVAQTPLEDILPQYSGVDGPLKQYAEQRQLRYLPRSLQKQRRLAENLIRYFFGYDGEDDDLVVEEPVVDSKPDRTYLEATPEELQAIAQLRQEGELGWLECVEEVGLAVPPDTHYRSVMSHVQRFLKGQDGG